MATTATHPRLRSSTKNHKRASVRNYEAQLERAQANLEQVSGRVRSGYRSTKKLIRQHPGASSAILIVGVGLVAGVLAGLAMRSRFASHRPNLPSPEAIADFIASWRR